MTEGVRGRSRWSRRLAVGALAGTLVVVGTQGSDAVTPFTAGQGYAEARVASIQFQYSGASLGFNVAHATAQFEDGTGSASADTLDSPFLDLVASLKTCGVQGFPSALVPPTASVTTNGNGNRGPVHATTPGTAGVGAASVDARPNADGHATIVAGSLSIPGLIGGVGGRAETDAQTQPGAQRRTSVADVEDSEVDLLGGIVKLRGMHWRAAVQVSGADSRADTRASAPSFEGGSISVAGVTVPFPQSPLSLAPVNALLAPFAVQLRLPPVSHDQAAGVSRASVGPLTIALGGKTPLGPALHQLATNLPAIENALKPNIFDPSGCNELAGLLKPVPQLNSAWNTLATGYPIIAAALVGSLDGGGELDINIGGVDASVDDTYYQTQTFGSPVFSISGGSTIFTPGSSTPSRATPPVVSSGTPAVAPPAVRTINTSVRCQTTSPAGRPMCWAGHAAAGGLAVAVLTIGLLTADEAFRRRRVARRELPAQEEVTA